MIPFSKEEKEELEDKMRSYFTKQLRRLFYRSPIRAALKKRVIACLSCSEELHRDDADIDHMEPVAPVDREITSFEYFCRMFDYRGGKLSLTNFASLCKKCHKKKSHEEIALRAYHKTGPFSKKSLDKRKATRKKRYGKKATKKKKS